MCEPIGSVTGGGDFMSILSLASEGKIKSNRIPIRLHGLLRTIGFILKNYSVKDAIGQQG
jgi:hypothetical protein